MTGTLTPTPRFTAQDLETASIRSAAPSYVSDVPSYHSTAPSMNPHNEAVPAYTPRTAATTTTTTRPAPLVDSGTASPRQQTIGLPPIPAAPALGVPSLHNFRLPTWSTNNTLAYRHYQNVAERRVMAGRYGPVPIRRYVPVEQPQTRHRPLEDPYLVGEQAAAIARRERLAREAGDDILIREDRQWDWWLARMKDHDDRERSDSRSSRGRRDVEGSHRKRLLHRIGGRILA